MTKKETIREIIRRVVKEEKSNLKEVMNSNNVLFYVTKEKQTDGVNNTLPEFGIELRVPNAMPIKFVHNIPNKIAMQMEQEIEQSLKSIFDKYKKYQKS
jgi:flagellar biosynthesis/type III secretory pathway chaperone